MSPRPSIRVLRAQITAAEDRVAQAERELAEEKALVAWLLESRTRWMNAAEVGKSSLERVSRILLRLPEETLPARLVPPPVPPTPAELRRQVIDAKRAELAAAHDSAARYSQWSDDMIDLTGSLDHLRGSSFGEDRATPHDEVKRLERELAELERTDREARLLER